MSLYVMQKKFDYKLQNVAPHRKFRAGLALIPLSTDPDGVLTAPDGSGRLLVGPQREYATRRNAPHSV